jgi:hypothetical protein
MAESWRSSAEGEVAVAETTSCPQRFQDKQALPAEPACVGPGYFAAGGEGNKAYGVWGSRLGGT